MPWCPKCKYEYREGMTFCSDCDCELVDDLSLVSEEQSIEAVPDISQLFAMNLENEGDITEDGMFPGRDQNAQKEDVYVSNEEKAEDNITSAYTLIFVGAAGLVLIVLFFLGIISIEMAKFSKYMITGVMGTMFTLFFIMGIVSLKNFRVFKEKANSENNLTQQIKSWCIASFDKEAIDSNFDFEGVPDELKYFQRFKFIKDNINNQFMNLDPQYVDKIAEDIYPDIFE